MAAHEITAETVHRAIDTYLAVPTTGVFPLGCRYDLNLAKTVRAQPEAYNSVLNPKVRWVLKRETVRKAILSARPEKR
jgi:hypothetical protein